MASFFLHTVYIQLIQLISDTNDMKVYNLFTVSVDTIKICHLSHCYSTACGRLFYNEIHLIKHKFGPYKIALNFIWYGKTCLHFWSLVYRVRLKKMTQHLKCKIFASNFARLFSRVLSINVLFLFEITLCMPNWRNARLWVRILQLHIVNCYVPNNYFHIYWKKLEDELRKIDM